MSLPPNYNLLSKYPNTYYIETGCWTGDSMQIAIQAKAFSMFIGIESDPEKVRVTKDRFRYNKAVSIIQGDSGTDLILVLNHIKVPATILLDAHDSLIEGEIEHPNPFPLLQELKQISENPVKTHTIIIDDILHLTHPRITGWGLEHIYSAIYNISSNYNIILIANPVKNNMLIATPR